MQQTSHPVPGLVPNGVDAIHPDVQWEISAGTVPPKYADAMRYEASWNRSGTGAAAGPDPSFVPMDLWELKTSVSYGSYAEAAASAGFQAWAYAELLKWTRTPSNQGQSLWAGLTPSVNDGYTDDFIIERRTCKDNTAGKPAKTAIDHIYHVFDSNSVAGAVIAERTVREYKCKDDRTRESEVYKEELPYEAYKWFRWGMPKWSRPPVRLGRVS